MNDKLLLIILSVLLPPVAVYLKKKGVGKEFWISLVLTIFFFVPGVIYALYISLK
jgi:uncharacterized membrane protein YqaE (UPF0057 family)